MDAAAFKKIAVTAAALLPSLPSPSLDV